MALTPEQHKDLRQLNRLLRKWVRIAQKSDVKSIDATWQKKYKEFVHLFMSTRTTLEKVKENPEEVSITPTVKETVKTEPVVAVKKEETPPKKEEPKQEEPAPVTNISRSVGKKGKNRKHDVKLVQELLNQKGAKLGVDGICGKMTIKAIHKFQQKYAGYKYGDGRIDPGGKSWKALTGGSVVIPKEEPTVPKEEKKPVKETPKKETPTPVKKEPVVDKTTPVSKEKEEKKEPEVKGPGYEIPKPNIPKIDTGKPHNVVIKKEEDKPKEEQPNTHIPPEEQQLIEQYIQQGDNILETAKVELSKTLTTDEFNDLSKTLNDELAHISTAAHEDTALGDIAKSTVDNYLQDLTLKLKELIQQKKEDIFTVRSGTDEDSDIKKIPGNLRKNIRQLQALESLINRSARLTGSKIDKILEVKDAALKEFDSATAAQKEADEKAAALLNAILSTVLTVVLPGLGAATGIGKAIESAVTKISSKLGKYGKALGKIYADKVDVDEVGEGALGLINDLSAEFFNQQRALEKMTRVDLIFKNIKQKNQITDKALELTENFPKLVGAIEKLMEKIPRVKGNAAIEQLKEATMAITGIVQRLDDEIRKTRFILEARLTPNLSSIGKHFERGLWYGWIPAKLSKGDDWEDYQEKIEKAKKLEELSNDPGFFQDAMKKAAEETRKEAEAELESEQRRSVPILQKFDVKIDLVKEVLDRFGELKLVSSGDLAILRSINDGGGFIYDSKVINNISAASVIIKKLIDKARGAKPDSEASVIAAIK